MRLWTIHPQYLDAAGLNACWRESLLAKKVLLGQTKGYKNHPQLIRFRETGTALESINAYLNAIFEESVLRGYCYDSSKIEPFDNSCKIEVTSGQLEYERDHLRRKLERRSPEWLSKIALAGELKPHPLFEVVSGAVEHWEVVSE